MRKSNSAAALGLSLAILSPMCVTPSSAQNPLIRDQFTADPTARVFNGRVYLFPSHDIPAPADYARKDWFCMADYHVFSSDNLTDWTDHGVIVRQQDVPWGNPKGYSMWAPDCIEHNGKYYFYFPDGPKPVEGQRGGGFGIGVAIADRPEGPYKVIDHKIEGIAGIDPCVLQASDGNAYIFWGGGGLWAAKLDKDMVSLAKDNPTFTRKFGETEVTSVGVVVDEGLPAGFKEGPFAFERNGKFYLTYPWVEDKTECLAYAMSDNPLGPYQYMGKIMEQSPTGCWTNHHSLVEFQGEWYLFYHHNDYSPNFDKLRSARADKVTFNADGTINQVTPTLRGVGITDAHSRIQVDRYSEISAEGVSMDFVYEGKDTLHRFEGWQLTLEGPRAYAIYNDVNFDEAKKGAAPMVFTARVKSAEGAVLVVSDAKTKAVLATLDVPKSEQFVVAAAKVAKRPRGTVNLKVQSKDGRQLSVDWVSFDLKVDERYFSPLAAGMARPDDEGFIRRWSILEPISKPNRTNTVFVDTYLDEVFAHEYFRGQMTAIPYDRQSVEAEYENVEMPRDYRQQFDPSQVKVTHGTETLWWHKLDCKASNIKLMRFGEYYRQRLYGVIYWVVTTIHVEEDLQDVRLSVGSNSASKWWIQDCVSKKPNTLDVLPATTREVLTLSGDRRMVADDGMSLRLSLPKGDYVVRGAIINGPGMSDFCVRLIGADGKPVVNGVTIY